MHQTQPWRRGAARWGRVAAAVLALALPGLLRAQGIPIDGGTADTQPPGIGIEPGSHTRIQATAPTVGPVEITYCDASGYGTVSVTFRGQSYPAVRDASVGSVPGCDLMRQALYRVNVTAQMVSGDNVLTVNSCDALGNCGPTTATYSWHTQAPDVAPEVQLNFTDYIIEDDSIFGLQVRWFDDRGLNSASRMVKVNGVAAAGLTFTTTAATEAMSSGTIRLATGWNTVSASIADDAGHVTTRSARIFSRPNAPRVSFLPDSLRTSDTLPSVTVQFTDDFGFPDEYTTWSVQLNGIDVSSRFGFSGGTNFGPTTVQSQGQLPLKPGFNTLTARACDTYGRCGTGTARHLFRHVSTRGQPQVSLAPTATDQRIPSPFEGTYAYSTPSYVSRDQPRSVNLVYYSGQAAPRGMVEVDAFDASSQPPSAMSIRVYNASGAAVTPEIFYRSGNGATRLAASWDAATYPTSAQMHTVVVRSYWSDGAYQESPAASARVVVVNEQNSVFGAGWSMVGLQRLHLQGDGNIVLTEGDGRAGLFTSTGCVTTTFTRCGYTSPAGDFSNLWYYPGSGYYHREYPDASYARFNLKGLMTEAADRFGNKTQFRGWRTANGRGQVDSIIDPAGLVTRLAYHGGSDGHTGKLASVTDPGGRVSRFGYWDGLNNLTTLQDPDNVGVTLAYGGTTARLLSTITHRSGGQTSLEYDHAQLVTAIRGPAVPSGTGGTLVRAATTVRPAVSRVLPAGTTSLSAPGARTAAAEAWNVVKLVTGDSSVFTLDRWRQVASSRADDGTVSRMIRNAAGRDSLHVSADADTITHYWSGPHLTAVVLGTADTLMRYTYTSPVWPITVRAQEWMGGKLTTSYFWNSRALLDSVSGEGGRAHYTHDALGRPQTVTDDVGRVTSFTYDPTGFRNTGSVTTDGRVVRFGYDAFGRTTAVTDALGKTDTLGYDVLNRASFSADPLGNRTRFHHGAAFLDSLTDARGQRYHYARTLVGADTASQARGGRTRTWYNMVGQPDSVRDRRGQVVRFVYDPQGRLKERRAGTDTTFFSYDTAGAYQVVRNAVSTDTLYSFAQGVGTSEVAVRGGRRYVGEWKDSFTGFVDHSPEFLFPHTRTFRFTDPENIRVLSTEDYLTDDILARIAPDRSRPVNLMYDTQNRLRGLRYPGGDSVRYTYTGQDGLIRVSYGSPALENALGTLYRRDALGRVIHRINAPLDSAWLYRYDDAGRLLRSGPYDPGTCAYSKVDGYDCSVQYSDTTTWTTVTYDGVGNRTDQGADVQTGNRTVRFGAYTMAYDSAGFMVRKLLTANPASFDRTFSWNALGQLTSVTTNGQTVSFAYDGLGRRVRRTSAAGTVEYVYSGNRIVVELDGGGAHRASYTYLPGVDLPLSMTRGGKTYYYHRDHLGSITALTDTTGAIVNRYRYDPWGRTTVVARGVENPYGFTGREYDEDSGLYYYRARYYDPQLGRFISEDPIGLSGGISLYGYAANDPVNMADPSGLSPGMAMLQGPDPGAKCEDGQEMIRINGRFWDSVPEEVRQAWLSNEDFCIRPEYQLGTLIVTYNTGGAITSIGGWYDPYYAQRFLYTEMHDYSTGPNQWEQVMLDTRGRLEPWQPILNGMGWGIVTAGGFIGPNFGEGPITTLGLQTALAPQLPLAIGRAGYMDLAAANGMRAFHMETGYTWAANQTAIELNIGAGVPMVLTSPLSSAVQGSGFYRELATIGIRMQYVPGGPFGHGMFIPW